MENKKTLDYRIINEAFTREGWTMYHQFMVGNRYVRGTDIVTWYYGHFKLNGKSVSDEAICDMLKIDKRILEVNDAIAPHPIHSIPGCQPLYNPHGRGFFLTAVTKNNPSG